MANRILGRRWLTGLGVLGALVAVSLAWSRAMQAKPTQPWVAQIPAQQPDLKSEPLAAPTEAPPGLNANSPAMPEAPPMARDLQPMPVATAPKPPITEDPEGSAGEFLERTRREATEAVQALSAEAESLRARLARTEAGLKRWQGVLGALDAQAPGVPAAPSGAELKPAEAARPPSDAPVAVPSEPPTIPEPGETPPAAPSSVPPGNPGDPPSLPKSAG